MKTLSSIVLDGASMVRNNDKKSWFRGPWTDPLDGEEIEIS